MSAEKRTQSRASDADSTEQTSDLSGFTAAIGGGLDPTGATLDPLLGVKINDVTIVRVLAEGGMGRVYEGLQDKPRRAVAVKVIKPGCASQEAIRRFESESEVLGRLRHQYIAQIFSAGICNVVGAQVPFFVMEFIPDALPLTKFAAAHKLSTEQRLELFHKVCEAVAHGHDNKVIHRDLKPGNILVERSGVPKVIDFGVARCVDATPEAMTVLTDMGKLIGTVQYMSPEQFSANPADVDVRADVYALGVILYELLTGKPPYEIRHKQIFEAAKVVREQKPVSPAKLNQSVRPDLVRITGTCLHKDRNRRYASAAELAAAVGSYLSGAAVPQPGRGGRSGFAWGSGAAWSSSPAFRPLAPGLTLLGIAAVWAWWLLQPPTPARSPTPTVVHFNGHAYGVFLEHVTQAEAAERCREQSGYLAQIETAAEHTAVARAALQSGMGQGYLWIAGLRPAGSKAWLLYDRKEPLAYFHRGIERLNVQQDSGDGPLALAIAVDDPVAYWQPLDPNSQAAGFICEWNDSMNPRERSKP